LAIFRRATIWREMTAFVEKKSGFVHATRG
jgi:hypothetical protein